MRTYLDPTAPIASDAMLTDDPKGAMDLAAALCVSPLMSNLSHGLWGYYGKTNEDAEVTIQSLGIGGPSAAAVMSDLAQLGVIRAIRIGSCIALDETLEPGSTFVATELRPGDGAGVALSGGRSIAPDPRLTEALIQALDGADRGAVRSVDIAPIEVGGDDARAADLSSAAFSAAAERDGITYACALVVAGTSDGPQLGREELEQALLSLGLRAATALSAVPQASG